MLGGGIALGAFEAGACAVLLEQRDPAVDWVAGVSIGAVYAALIAGGPPERAADRLRSFWRDLEANWPFALQNWFSVPRDGIFRQIHKETSVFETLMFGRPGLFQPRLALGKRIGVTDVPALFDLAPLHRTVTRWVDLDRLKDGKLRVTICCTDIVAGEQIVFDTGRRDRIGVEHIVASSALLPVFAPIEFDGRLLGDGALSGNVPIDAVLYDDAGTDRLCFVVELFGKAGRRPRTLAASANRAADLGFGDQTQRMLEGWERENRLRAKVARLGTRLPPTLRRPGDRVPAGGNASAADDRAGTRYHGGLDEAGLFKGFDFSKATLDDRWQAGVDAMQETWLKAGISADASP